MNENKITIRRAVAADAPLVGKAVLMALHYDEENPLFEAFVELAGREVSQYSYRNALVGEVNGVAAGAVVGYDGALLQRLRKPLLDMIAERIGEVPFIEDETAAGEFYVDSLAILPQFRGLGVGRCLLAAMRDNAFAAGFSHVGLLVDVENPRAEALYSSLGFKRVNETTFLGHNMWHLQAKREE